MMNQLSFMNQKSLCHLFLRSHYQREQRRRSIWLSRPLYVLRDETRHGGRVVCSPARA